MKQDMKRLDEAVRYIENVEGTVHLSKNLRHELLVWKAKRVKSMVCYECGERKPLNKFAKRWNALNGRNQPCNKCKREYVSELRAEKGAENS